MSDNATTPNRFIAEDGDVIPLGKFIGTVNMVSPAQHLKNLKYDRGMREARETPEPAASDENHDDALSAAAVARARADAIIFDAAMADDDDVPDDSIAAEEDGISDEDHDEALADSITVEEDGISDEDHDDSLAAYNRQDYATALRLWQPLAEQGDATAQILLGNMYVEGRGVPKDDALAVKWYRLAADQGNAMAQFSLGFMYDNGRGVPKDDVLAYMWSNLGAADGNQDRRKNRDIVAARMTPAQIAEAQRLSREWKPK